MTSLSQNKQDTENALHLSTFSQRIVSNDFKIVLIDYLHQNCHNFPIARPLPVCQMAIHRHFYQDFMTFFFDKSFL